jgi:hypothetical protein
MDWFDSAEVPLEASIHQPRSLPLGSNLFASHGFFSKRSACQLVEQALGSEGRVDFPTVTEICEGVAGNSDEMAAVADMLSHALQVDGALPKDSLLSLQLKALTVVHELLYDADARIALVEAPGLLASVRHLNRKHHREVQMLEKVAGGPASECVRLLTSEICRSLESMAILQL